jgi:hypothetical protein
MPSARKWVKVKKGGLGWMGAVGGGTLYVMLEVVTYVGLHSRRDLA